MFCGNCLLVYCIILKFLFKLRVGCLNKVLDLVFCEGIMKINELGFGYGFVWWEVYWIVSIDLLEVEVVCMLRDSFEDE